MKSLLILLLVATFVSLALAACSSDTQCAKGECCAQTGASCGAASLTCQVYPGLCQCIQLQINQPILRLQNEECSSGLQCLGGLCCPPPPASCGGSTAACQQVPGLCKCEQLQINPPILRLPNEDCSSASQCLTGLCCPPEPTSCGGATAACQQVPGLCKCKELQIIPPISILSNNTCTSDSQCSGGQCCPRSPASCELASVLCTVPDLCVCKPSN